MSTGHLCRQLNLEFKRLSYRYILMISKQGFLIMKCDVLTEEIIGGEKRGERKGLEGKERNEKERKEKEGEERERKIIEEVLVLT